MFFEFGISTVNDLKLVAVSIFQTFVVVQNYDTILGDAQIEFKLVHVVV